MRAASTASAPPCVAQRSAGPSDTERQNASRSTPARRLVPVAMASCTGSATSPTAASRPSTSTRAAWITSRSMTPRTST
jgi:hypothetical protein